MGIIDVDELWFSYDQQRDVLKNINLSMHRGEIIAFLGPNGSGKTTLLKCLNMLLEPKSGGVYLNGTNIAEMKRADIAKIVSYVPQDHKPTFPYSVIDVVMLGRSPHIGILSVPKKEDILMSYEMLNALGIGHLSERLYTEISGGERKLCFIARSLNSSPRVLIMDEPTAYLDIKHQTEVLNHISELAKKGITVIMTLHDPNLATLIADRVVLLKEGEIIKEGIPAKVVTAETIKETYDCEVLSVKYGQKEFICPKIN